MDVDEVEEIKKILDYLKLMKKISPPSPITLIKARQSTRLKYFNAMKFNSHELPITEELALKMEREGLLYQDEGNYMITMKFLIINEYYKDGFDLEKFLNDLNENYYSKAFGKKRSPLNGDEKAIILTLMGLLSFNEDSAFKSDSEEHSKVFKDCVEKAVALLKDLSYADSTLENIWSLNARQEGEVQAKLARLDNIKVKTNNIYDKPRNGHCLRLLKDGHIDAEKFQSLMKKIFDRGPLTLEQKNKLIEVLKQIYYCRHRALTNVQIDPGISNELYEYVRKWMY